MAYQSPRRPGVSQALATFNACCSLATCLNVKAFQTCSEPWPCPALTGDRWKFRSPVAQAKAMGLSRWVHFTGWVGQPEVARLMAAADVLVLPSYDEGLPLVILEALANGVAVVCSPVGEISTVLTDEVDAIFVQAGNVHELSAGLQRVLRDPLLRQSLEQNGRLLYEQKFSLQRFFIEVARIHFQHFGVSARSRPCAYKNQAETTPQHDHACSLNTPVLSVADSSSAEAS